MTTLSLALVHRWLGLAGDLKMIDHLWPLPWRLHPLRSFMQLDAQYGLESHSCRCTARGACYVVESVLVLA
ncbi:hypothetical protein BJY00DRAFT_288201 [Aspergillus carlsbadensis]|nr:hypothetical protein BJY00DRAFT_288201 [Aspergillus carlsbadensis]